MLLVSTRNGCAFIGETALPASRLKNVVIHPDSGSIIAVAEFPVTVDRLFRALIAADEISRWWGGAGTLPSVLWIGVPVKGTGWRAEGSRNGGRVVFTAFGNFLDVDAPRQVQLSWHGSWDLMAPTRVSLRFEPVLNGAVLTLLHQGFLGREQACRRQGRIWYLAIKWLGAHLEAEAALRRKESDQVGKTG